MDHDSDDQHGGARALSRRGLLAGATAAGLAGLAGSPQAAAGERPRPRPPAEPAAVVPFHGKHQAGIVTAQQTHALFVAFDVVALDGPGLSELLRLWTLAVEAMSQGLAPPPRPSRLPDVRQDAGLTTGLPPARLTATFGFGPRLFDGRYATAPRRPEPLAALPAFPGDQLVAEHSDGDVLLQLCADDPQILSAVFLQLRSLAAGRATLRWSQQGFVSPPPDGRAPRNLLGLHDGTSNPAAGSRQLDRLVWADGRSPAWMRDGTYLVFRKIRLGLPTWSLTGVAEQDRAVGRRMPDGSPLSAPAGSGPDVPLDLRATGPDGRPLIDEQAHVRRMHDHPMLRRAYNYDLGFDSTRAGHHDGDDHTGHGGHEAYDAGLLFVTFNADPRRQFVPAQQALTDGDLLARFMTPTASAVFAVPPGLRPGQHYGQLFA